MPVTAFPSSRQYTGLGLTPIEMPRAWLIQDGREQEWHSHLVARYQRRAASVDAALMGDTPIGAALRS